MRRKIGFRNIYGFFSLFTCILQNALAATAAPFPGQFSGYEAFPQYATAAATGKILSKNNFFMKIY